jgi:hypothetical protein
MSAEVQESGGKRGKSKQKKITRIFGDATIERIGWC